MIKYLKIRSTHIIVKFILGIIILSLVLSTASSYINQDYEKYIAVVNGEKIRFKIFQNMYFIEREKQKKILGKDFLKWSKNKKFIKETYNYILFQLINNVLLEQYTKKLQLQASNYAIKKIILNSSLFQINNKFNKEKYFNYLTSINCTNREYMDIIQTKISTENLIHTIANSNFILKNEQKKIIELLSQKRMIKKSIVKIDPAISKQNVTDIEAKNYFSKYKNHFYIPKKFKISFVQLKSNQFKKKCDDREINEWYLKNIKKYSTKEKRKYSIIQTKTKYEALLILSKLYNKPENFSKIAQEKSTDPISSKNGGDIGWISINLIPSEIKNANLNKKNQISNIIPFHNEFLIIKLDEIKLKKTKKINEVYNTIKEEIENKKSLDSYYQLQKKISNIIKTKSDEFNVILKEINMSAKDTNWFDKKSIPKILNIPILKELIFHHNLIHKDKKLKPHANFIVLKNNQSFLISIKDIKNKKMQNFKDVKNNIIKKIKFIKAIKEVRKKSEKIIKELKTGSSDLFTQSHLYFTKSEIISRYDESPITSIVFSLPHPKNGKKIYTLYQDKNKNFIIIFLENIYNKNFSEQERNIIFEYLEKNNNEIIFNSILKNLRETATIKYEKIEKI